MQAVILGLELVLNLIAQSPSRVDLLSQFLIILQLEAICNFAESTMLHVAFLKDERGILLHFLTSLSPLVVTIGLNLDLFHRKHLFAFELDVELDGLASLAGHHVVQLTRKVLAGEREVLREHNLAKNVLAKSALDALLIIVGQLFENLPWLLSNDFIQHRDKFEELGRHLIDFHRDGIGELVQISILEVRLDLVHKEWFIHNLHAFWLHRSFDVHVG